MKEKNNKINMLYNLKLYFGLLKRYRNGFAFLILLILITNLANISDKLLFKALIDNGTMFAGGSLAKPDFLETLYIIAAIFSMLIAIKASCKWLNLHLLNKIESSLIFDLKRKFFNHIISLSYRFHTTHKTGSLISRLTRGGRAVERITDIFVFNIATLVFELLIVSLSVVYFDIASGIVALITVLFFIGYSLFIQHLQQNPNLLANEAEDIEKANISDIFTNIESIKYFGKEITIKNKFSKIIENTKEFTLRHWNYFRWLDFGHNLILGIGTFFIVYFPLTRFLEGTISLGTLIFIYTAYASLVGPLFGFVYGIRDFYKAMADFESLFKYAKIKNEVKDKTNARDLIIKEGTIIFKSIKFSYGKRKIFENLSLVIPKNKKIAFVGHSGSGKSTLIKLLYRFYDLDSGQVLIDSHDIKEFRQESLRSSMSIVPQECILFDDTIYNNVAFSKQSASKQEVLSAIRFAHLDKIIEKFPKKENTIVGERGIKLSGGEKQRVSIARAILANKKVLVLDEATSSLDSETEHEIQADLEKLMQGRTVIIIAHRLSTIMKSDKIIVMDKGKIVQSGTHKDLIRQEGHYRKLWGLQKSGYIR